MSSSRPTRALAYGSLAAVLATVAVFGTIRSAGWSLTALPRVDSQTQLGAIAHRLDPGFRTVHPGAYDGQFYWGIALDPLATGSAHKALDKMSYRYGHPLYGWLAWLISGGQAQAVPAALAALGIASLFTAAVLATALAEGRRGSGWEALFVALNLGLISSVVHDLAEPLAAALLLGALWTHARGRLAASWICLALLPLAKEPLALVLLAVIVWELRRHHTRHAAILALAGIPALAWWTYARIQLGAWFTSGDTALGLPAAGWARALLDPVGRAHEPAGRHAATVAILVVLLGALALGCIRALQLRSPLDYAYLGLAAVAVCLAPNATVAFSTALRNTAFLTVLLPFIITRRPKLRTRWTDNPTHPE